MDMRLELVPLPTSDVDRSKAFYTEQMGFVLDHDIEPGNGMRETLVSTGVEVSPVQDMGGVKYAHLSDPDGNTWALQQIPG
jgi:predicted enzyme related to lactoylglutathione lyase